MSERGDEPKEGIENQLTEINRLKQENAFLKSFLQVHSLHMGGRHSWRFMGGWPISAARGPTPDDAVRHAMELVAESKGAKP